MPVTTEQLGQLHASKLFLQPWQPHQHEARQRAIVT